jgi:3-oxoacyl-[acyl-carrier-protein] synthase-1|tara:strand:+ start:5637 stop:6860 length:1224 start_codon:yes stop_codon:yes gene_type:complete
MERRVVVTGMGIYSCLGSSLSEVKESLYKGKSGIVFDEDRIRQGFQSGLTGYVKEPNLKGILTRRQRLGLGQPASYAYVATKDALNDAKIDQDFLDKNEVGVLFGNDSTVKNVVESIDLFKEKKDTSLIGSSYIFKSMNSTITMNLATLFKLKGVNFTISAACASGSHSVGIAYLLIKQGLQDVVICGGAQEINPVSMATFDALGAFSKNNSNPTKASKPFDVNRDGLIPSGGAATLILEDYEHAIKRGAKIYGEVMSYGFSSNGSEHLSAPNVDGPKRAMLKSLKMSGLKASDINYVNAHATSTPAGDINEGIAILETFGKHNPYVSSTKSMTGHECWMAGASELIYSLIMMNNNFVAPNINLETPEKELRKLNFATKTIDTNINAFLSNSFGFGGTNASIIIKKI